MTDRDTLARAWLSQAHAPREVDVIMGGNFMEGIEAFLVADFALTQVKAARAEALEEASLICDGYEEWTIGLIIRASMEPPA